VNVVPNDAVPNPLNQVPVLEFTSPKGEKIQLTQSLAVIELLDDLYPSELCPLLPTDVMLRARVKEIAELVTSGIQPLQSIGIIRQVKHFEAGDLKGDGSDYAKLKCKEGMDALEKLLSALRAPVLHQQLGSPQAVYAAGTAYPTLADLCVVPQLYNAKVRLGITVDESTHPHVCAVEAACRELEAFRVAAPEMQPDAMKTDGLL
jgi:maleylacetoacetate isomerase